MTFALNTLISALVIASVSWLSGRSPILAGVIAALPLSTMLILPMSQLQHGETNDTYLLAKSIFIAAPATLTFFVPFLFSERLGLSFWKVYLLGCACLAVGLAGYRAVTRYFFPDVI